MEVLSLQADIILDDKSTVSVVYNLTQSASLYGIECYLENSEKGPSTYRLVPQISANRQYVTEYIYKLAYHKVMPLHIEEIIEDSFPRSIAL